MKIKILNGILMVDILTVLLILAILLFPSIIARIILGIPFLLFFPGYALVSALFIEKKTMENLEKLALSFGMSIAVIALIGFGLNYTNWGIRLEPVIYSVASFIIAVSAIALIRRAVILNKLSLTTELKFRLPGWESSKLNKSVSIFLIAAILGAVSVLGYNIAAPKIGENYTEFYILGLNGKAQSYPTQFLIKQGQVTGISYDAGETIIDGTQGTITLGIVNHEQQKATYSITTIIDGKQTDIYYAGKSLNRVGPIELKQGEKWEHELGFTPQHTGDNQKVEFLLYKGSDTSPYNSLHLWVNAKEED